MKNLIEALLQQALGALPNELMPRSARQVNLEVEHTRDPAHGDFASNLAMRLAKTTRQNPRKLAQALIAALPANDVIAKVEVAGAGFINFFLEGDAYHREVARILSAADAYGRSALGAGRSVLLLSLIHI